MLIFAFTANARQKKIEVNITLNPGYTMVDIEKSSGIPLYENSSGYYLNDWSQFHYGGVIQGIINSGKKFEIGGEIAWHRLYYWEEAVGTYYGSTYYYGDATTLGLGFIGKYNLSEVFYLKPGAGFQFYTNDDFALTFGTTAALGINLKLSDSFAIPIELRTDQILGDALSFVVSLGIGVQFEF